MEEEGREERGEEVEGGRNRVATALQRVAEHWVGVQLAQASTQQRHSAVCACARARLDSMSAFEPASVYIYKCVYALTVCINTTEPHTYRVAFSVQYVERWQKTASGTER